MKASKFMMSLSAAVFGGVMYMQIAGACSRTQAAVLGTAMLVCMAICYADLQREKRRKACRRIRPAERLASPWTKRRTLHTAPTLMRQIR